MVGNFAALLLTDLKFSALKDLNRLKKYTKYQETSYNFKLSFAPSNRPHFISVYLVQMPFLTGIAVFLIKSAQFLSITVHVEFVEFVGEILEQISNLHFQFINYMALHSALCN